MADGYKKIVINTQERAVSTDINRLQLFRGKDVSELLRYALDVTGNDDLDAGAVISEPNTIETPLRAEIVNGILARPQSGSVNVFIDPGVVMFMAPDAAADESNYKYVSDAGNTTPGALVIAAGGGGAIRIDVVECRINPIDLIVSDSRDIFNPSTGLFTATSVTKERSGRIEYRVRQGVAGAGYPGNVGGWLPLCIASVPDTAVNNDTVTFWDVRPLLSDRTNGLFNLSEDYPVIERLNYTADPFTVGTELRLGGSARVNSPTGRKLGGQLRRGTPGTDNAYVDLREAANLASGYTIPAGADLFYAYLLTPFSLPRWARYKDFPLTRVPRSPRGICVTTGVVPRYLTGAPSAVIALPTSTGLGGSTTAGICIAAFYKPAGSFRGGIAMNNQFTLGPITLGASLTPMSGFTTASTATGAFFTDFTLVPGVTHPANAKYVYMSIELVVTLDTTEQIRLIGQTLCVYIPGFTTDPVCVIDLGGPGTAVNTSGVTKVHNVISAPVRVPVASEYPAAAGSSLLVKHRYAFLDDVGTAVVGPSLARIVGWEF